MTTAATGVRARPPRWLLQDNLLAAVAAGPDKAAVIAEGERYDYGELLDASLRLARALQELGVKRGDRVAIQMDNSFACATAIFGTLLAGGIFIVVNPQTKADKLHYILADSETTVLLADGHLAREYTSAVRDLPSLKAVIRTGIDEIGEATTLPFDDVLAGSEPAPADPGTVAVDLAALIYTSGSTGNPKGVMVTHQNMVFAAESISRYLRLGPEDRILNVLPLAFDYGLYQLLMAVGLGATLVLEKSFAFPAHVFRRIEEHEVTVFPGVPTVFATLLSLGKKSPLQFPSVTRVTNTAAALPPDFLTGLAAIFPNALVFAMYGLTECKRVAYLEPELLAEKPSSVGKAIPGTEAFVLLPDGTPAPPGETGILHVRGPHVMVGYWRRPDLTAEMLREGRHPGERILCTHDHFKTDEDGFLYFVGRSDDIIKTRGEKVSPVEVENVLYAIPGVRQAAVLGVPDELLGEAIRAFVVLEETAELTEHEIIRACRAKLENFMVPQQVVLLDALPQTGSGKIRKAALPRS